MQMPKPSPMDHAVLIALLAEVLGVPETSLEDSIAMRDVPSWDSLRHIELVVRLEETFGLQLTSDEIVEMVTIGAIRKVLARHVAVPV